MTQEDVFNIAKAHYQARKKSPMFVVDELEYCQFFDPCYSPTCRGDGCCKGRGNQRSGFKVCRRQYSDDKTRITQKKKGG